MSAHGWCAPVRDTDARPSRQDGSACALSPWNFSVNSSGGFGSLAGGGAARDQDVTSFVHKLSRRKRLRRYVRSCRFVLDDAEPVQSGQHAFEVIARRAIPARSWIRSFCGQHPASAPFMRAERVRIDGSSAARRRRFVTQSLGRHNPMRARRRPHRVFPVALTRVVPTARCCSFAASGSNQLVVSVHHDVT
jgi:hypothetical protein